MKKKILADYQICISVPLISSLQKSASESDFSKIKGKSDGNVLPLSINEHCSEKEKIKVAVCTNAEAGPLFFVFFLVL